MWLRHDGVAISLGHVGQGVAMQGPGLAANDLKSNFKKKFLSLNFVSAEKQPETEPRHSASQHDDIERNN